VLLKLSGEILRGQRPSGLEAEVMARVSAELAAAREAGTQLALVVGGGNIFRGVTGEALGIDRASGDQIGMLSTVANGLALRSVLESTGVAVTLQSAIAIPGVVDGFDARAAVAALEARRVVIFVAGTGNPYFTTDTAAALRAIQVGADALLKGTKVDGVYSADPVAHPDATRYARLSYREVLEQQLGVMDLSATVLCQNQRLPVVVFDMQTPGALGRVVRGEDVGTLVAPEAAAGATGASGATGTRGATGSN
jgi:uridylate kinase